MSVKVTESFSVYWNYQVWHLAKGETVSGGLADYLAETGSPVEADGDGVPDGSAKEVLGWVGDDPARAALALQAENRRDKPRSTLVTDLEKLGGQ